MKFQPLSSSTEMIIKKKLGQSIFSLVHAHPMINPPIEIKREIKITVGVFD